MLTTKYRREDIGQRVLNIKAQQLIVTAHPEFATNAIAELKRMDKQLTQVDELAPGIILCSTPLITDLLQKVLQHRPTFIRHIAPVQTTVDLTNSPPDLGEMAIVDARQLFDIPEAQALFNPSLGQNLT